MITIEMPLPRISNRIIADAAVRGTKNVLAHIGVIKAEILPQTEFPVIPGEHYHTPSIRANRGGVLQYEVDEVEPGQFLEAGTVVARISDVFGNGLEAVRMPRSGYVSTFPSLSWVGNQTVASGDCFD